MKFIYIFILMFMGLHASTSTTIVLNNDSSVYRLDDKVSVFSDESKTLTLEQINAQNLWKPLASSQREGFKKTTLWLKFCVTNESTKNFFLYYNFPILANFEVFQETFDESDMHQMGSKFAQWDDGFGSPRFIVPLKLRPQEQTNMYVKLEHWGSIPLRFEVLDETALLGKENKISFINGLFIGILILIVAYHFILFWITRYSYYLSYTLMVASVLLFNIFYLGYGSKYIFTSSAHLFLFVYELAIYGMFFMLALFANHLLDFNIKTPKFWFGMKVVLAVYAVVKVAFLMSDPLSFQNSFSYTLIGLYHALMLCILFGLIAGALYLAMVQKDFIAKLYLLAWIPIVLTGFLFILEINGFVKDQEWLSYTVWISNSIEAILFSQILGYKIRQTIEEKRQLVLDKQYLEKELEERTQALKNQLYVDDLTGLKNRNALYAELNQTNMGALILVDIFDFKSINDHYGFDVGNDVLRYCAQSLKEYATIGAYKIYRLSSDLFALFKSCDTQRVDFHMVYAQTLLSFLRSSPYHSRLEVKGIDITCNIGIAVATSNLLEKAEMALRSSKKGDEPIVAYDLSMESIEQSSMTREEKREIQKAFDEDRFVPFFQPIVDHNQKIIKYEVLMRMVKIDENGEQIYLAPARFFDYILRAKLYKEISLRVIEKSFQQMATREGDFSINVNYQEVGSEEFKQAFIELLKHYDMSKRVIVEITESENIQSYEVLQAFVEEIRTCGVRIAIDDFGSGFSNFEHILKISPEYIKIDGSLMQHINHDKQSHQLVKSIISFAKEMKIRTIGEFVSEKSIFETAKQLGVDEYQGYYFGVPSAVFH